MNVVGWDELGWGEDEDGMSWNGMDWDGVRMRIIWHGLRGDGWGWVRMKTRMGWDEVGMRMR